jgi:hypothetical protein
MAHLWDAAPGLTRMVNRSILCDSELSGAPTVYLELFTTHSGEQGRVSSSWSRCSKRETEQLNINKRAAGVHTCNLEDCSSRPSLRDPI